MPEVAFEPEYDFAVTNLGLAGLGCRRLVTGDLGDPPH